MRQETLLDVYQSTMAHRGKQGSHSTFVRRPDQQATSGISKDANRYSPLAEKLKPRSDSFAQHLGRG